MRAWLAATAAAVATGAYAQTQATPQGAGPGQASPPALGAAGQKSAAPKAGKASKAATPKAAPSKTVDEVVVTGASQNGFRSSIDRRSYGVANDLAATTGTISDALKNIPSVEVDVQGNVSLRGDTNVTILVDGKPSALFRGQSAAQALQSLPADSVERVEVITNPSAEFSPDGSAGIINLVMKKTHRIGTSGSMRYNVGTAGRRNGGVSGAYSSDALTLSGDAGFRHDPQHSVSEDTYTLIDPTGAPTQTVHEVNDNRGPYDQWNARVGLDYDLNKTDRVSGEVHANQTDLDFHNLIHLRGFDPTGALDQAFDQSGLLKQVRDNRGTQASWRRIKGVDDDVSLSASHETTYERNETAFDGITSLPAAPDNFQDIRGHNILALSDLRADLRRPMPNDGRLKVGYDLRIDDNSYDNVAARGVSQAVAGPDPTLSNLFLYKQTINAAYVTYEQPFGAFTVLGGLRLEDVELDLNQVTSALVHDSNAFNAYPTLHLNYRFSNNQSLTLSYSRRISRPAPSDLNPFRIESDPFNFRQGNPNLKPDQTDSFEAGYQYRAGGTFYLATAYYRSSTHDVTDVVTESGNIFLDTKENLNSAKHAGLELVANGHLTKDLSYNASTNVYYAEIEAGTINLPGVIGATGSRSAIEGGGRFSLNWQITPNDSAQASGTLNARRLTPQGYVEPSFISFLGYRHKFNDKFAAVVTVQDVFNSFDSVNIINTPQLRDRVQSTGRIRAAYVGFAWNFGTPPKRPPSPPPPEQDPETIHG
ncbi:TonB-dependent receptor domain-containing protein [Phenylobacterium sp.]|uniref:TonB-dependent receptor domain-containing protein n=1 Tax=Phenylobacterium sp. TaxID=1871053 RepID=UPI002F410488